jgi:hypothetical protein
MLERADYGDQDTTYLLRGLELVCRFRSMFLENDSDFLGANVSLTDAQQLPIVASKLLKELNLLRRDAQEAELDRPGTWTKYVDFGHIKAIAEAYRPCESKLREIIPKIMAAKAQPELLEPLGKEMAEVLTKMEEAVRPENGLLLREMAAELWKFSGKSVDSPEVFRSEALSSPKGSVGGHARCPHHASARPHLCRAEGACGAPVPPLCFIFWLHGSSGKIEFLEFS